MAKSMMNATPHPTIGEICQFLAGAFGTKSTDPKRRSQLNRLAREGDFDWTLSHKLVEEVLVAPIRKYDSQLADFVRRFVDHILDQHIKVVLHIQLDALTRRQALPILIELIYAAHTANFLSNLKDQFGGPDMRDFWLKDENPINIVFNWAEKELEIGVAHILYPDNKPKQDDIRRWRKGKVIPDFFASIVPLTRDLKEKRPDKGEQISLFGKWLFAARVLAWIAREAHGAKYGALMHLVRKEALLNGMPRDVGGPLSRANAAEGRRLYDLTLCGGVLINEMLSRSRPKSEGTQESARKEIDRFIALTHKLAPDGRTRYFLDWCEARWHVLSGCENAALKFYEQAANGALYRAGASQQIILEEAMALAALLRQKPLLKRLKHRWLAMGLVPKIYEGIQEGAELLSDQEIEQRGRMFPQLFPKHGFF